MYAKEYLVSINRTPVVGKPDKNFPWPDYMGGFEAEEVTGFELALRIGKGYGFAPVFNGDGYPRLANWHSSQFVAVDMDTEDEKSSMETLVNHPLTVMHGALIYPTHSHTPERPRHRLVFLIDEPMRNPTSYAQLQSFFAQSFDGDAAGGANKTWMGNGKIDQLDLWEQVYIPEQWALSREQVIHYITLWRKRMRAQEQHGNSSRRREWKQTTGGDYMSLHDLGQRLFKIDAYSIDYPDWVKIGAAIAHSYGQDGYWLFKDWSDRPGKTPLTMGKYRSLMAESGRPATYGTIIHFLKERNA